MSEIERLIEELKEKSREATQELIRYKATEKQLVADVEAMARRAEEWEKKAMAAVQAGDDELAKKALSERDAARHKGKKIDRDRAEMATYAAGLLDSRRIFLRKLAALELKKNTLEAQRSSLSLDHVDGELRRIEERMENDTVLAELDGDLDGLLAEAPPRASSAQADDELRALKEKMRKK